MAPPGARPGSHRAARRPAARATRRHLQPRRPHRPPGKASDQRSGRLVRSPGRPPGRRRTLAYLLGERRRYGRVFSVGPAVLIPRPETELLVDLALDRSRCLALPTLVDLGTGSGVVAVTLALERPAARVAAVDLSAGSNFAVARSNAERLGAGRFPCRQLVRTPGRAALRPHRLQPALRRSRRSTPGTQRPSFEPQIALTDGIAGGDGLACIRAIVAGRRPIWRPAAGCSFEHGYAHDQGRPAGTYCGRRGSKRAYTNRPGRQRPVSGGQI